jgi:hypothetical protein
LITKPTTVLFGGRQQFQRADQMRENAAPVDVGNDDHRAIDGLGKAHVGDVAIAQVDLGRRPGALDQHAIVGRRQAPQDSSTAPIARGL